MSDVFFPSCKAKEDYPQASRQLARYLKERYHIEPTGCCRAGYQGLQAGDRAIVVCPTCAAIFGESAPEVQIRFVWELIDQDTDFPFPDYQGMPMTLQDCWVSAEKRAVQDAVRSLLHKMHIEPVEQEEAYEKTRYCGVNMLKNPSEAISRLAPRRYLVDGAAMFHPMEPEQQTAALKRHCEQIPGKDVVCYCKFCKDGIDRGGKRGHHLLELLFPADENFPLEEKTY